MKVITLFSVFLLACFFPILIKAQLHEEPALLEEHGELIGIYWFPMSEKNVANPRKGFMFTENGGLRGHDGCNTFWGNVSYTDQDGFKVSSIIHTELKCREDAELFSVNFLYRAHSFKVQGREVVFFDKNRQEIVRLFSYVNVQEKNTVLPTGGWKVIESNTPDFQAVKDAGREPYLQLLKDGRFIVNYNKDRQNWTRLNYFAGYYNMNTENKNIYFHINAESGSLVMPNGEDAQVAHQFKMAQYWELKNKQLIIRANEYYFILEKL